MGERRRRRWPLRVGITAGVVVLLAVGAMVGWRLLMGHFVRQYYWSAYAPITLTSADVSDVPAEHHLDDVPWIAVPLPLCQSVSPQMIAAQQGSIPARRRVDFLMGFTYGASQLPGGWFAPFGTDPETGMKVAAPYLGLERRYYVTDDAGLYLRAVRSALAQGRPVRLALDMGRLYGADQFLAHSEVLVGYNEGGFFYYEPVCTAPATCSPGERSAGAPGLYVTEQKLLEAVLGQARALSYPWRYAFAIFVPGPIVQDLTPVWQQNAQALRGGMRYGPKIGAEVIEALADQIEKRGAASPGGDLQMGIAVAAATRPDNGAYLREAFPDDVDLQRAAALFDQAAEAYRAVQEAIADGIVDQQEAALIAAHLRRAAAAERAAGEIFAAEVPYP